MIAIPHNGALIIDQHMQKRQRASTYLIRKAHLQAETCAKAPPIIGPIKDARARQNDMRPLYAGSFVLGAIS
jgi:hypothetical protein